MKRVARTLVVVGAVAAGTLAIPAAANASVTSCATWVNGNVGYVACNTTNGSQYRAHVKCVKVVDPNQYYFANGKWVSSGPSSAGCVSETYVGAVQHQTR
jgi:hypothetical protein